MIIHICRNETHNNKYTLRGTPLATHSFLNVPWPREQSVVPQKLQTR